MKVSATVLWAEGKKPVSPALEVNYSAERFASEY